MLFFFKAALLTYTPTFSMKVVFLPGKIGTALLAIAQYLEKFCRLIYF